MRSELVPKISAGRFLVSRTARRFARRLALPARGLYSSPVENRGVSQ